MLIPCRFERREELVRQAARHARERAPQWRLIARELLFGGQTVFRARVHLGLDLLLDRGDPDHEELVEIGPEDRDELEPLEQRVALVERLLEDAVVELEPRQLAVDVERRVVERSGVGATGRAGSAPTCEPVSMIPEVRRVSPDFFAHLPVRTPASGGIGARCSRSRSASRSPGFAADRAIARGPHPFRTGRRASASSRRWRS